MSTVKDVILIEHYIIVYYRQIGYNDHNTPSGSIDFLTHKNCSCTMIFINS